jgi:hypothetical protein
MLRKLYFNRRSIPVPVPVRNLRDVLEWLQKTLLKPDEEITRVVLDGEDILARFDQKSFGSIPLDDKARLEVAADSPVDLAVQTCEALRNLAMVIERGLKTLAVTAWQTPPSHKIRDVDVVHGDLVLMYDLCGQLEPLIPADIDFSVLRYLVGRMNDISSRLIAAAKQGDWQAYARLLLNHLEPSLREVATETENVQTQLYSKISHIVMTRNTSSGVSIEGV